MSSSGAQLSAGIWQFRGSARFKQQLVKFVSRFSPHLFDSKIVPTCGCAVAIIGQVLYALAQNDMGLLSMAAFTNMV